MKIYTGSRKSNTPGDVSVRVQQEVGTCTRCNIEIPSGFYNKYEHFDETFMMCHAPIIKERIISGPLMKRTHIEPTDFEWGPTHQQGAANLAVALLWDILGEEPSRQLAKSFALNVISMLPRQEWSMSEREAREWIKSHADRYALTLIS